MATGDKLPLSSRAFLSAVRSGQVDVVQRILAGESRRNDINVQNDWGDTALLIAAQLGYLTICRMLLAGGACSAKQNNRGETCLHRACVTGHVKIVEAILERGTENVINKVDDEGFTALHLAAQLRPHSKAMEIARKLLCAGADAYLINNHGETSAAVARRCSNEGLAYYLETQTNEEDDTIQEMNCYKDIIVAGYKEALNTMCYVTTQARLVLVGNSGSGKTSLKKTLFGEIFSPKEPPTRGIDADPSSAKVAFKQYRDWVLQPISKVEVHRLGLIYVDLIINHILSKIRSIDMRRTTHTHIEAPRKVLFRERESIRLVTGTSFDDRFLFNPDGSTSSQFLSSNLQESNEHISESTVSASHTFVASASPLVSHGDTSNSVPSDDSDESCKSSFSADLSQVPQEVLRRLLLRWNVSENPKYLDSQYTMLSVSDISGHPLMLNVAPLFFTYRCIFLGVTNISKPIDSSSGPHVSACLTDIHGHIPCEAEVLDEWLTAVAAKTKPLPMEPLGIGHTRCPRLPPIILVGAQVDKCDSNCELQKMSEFVNCRCFLYHMSQHNPPTIFCCSSMMESQSEYGEDTAFMPHAGHHLLRREIDTLARILPFSHEKIPLKWLKFQQIICSLKDQQKCLLFFEELSGFVKEQCPEQFTDVEVHIMFLHYHSLGRICYYSTHKQLSQLIITDPQWLMNAAASVIKPSTRPWYTQTVKEEFAQLSQQGIIEMSIMQLPYRYSHLPPQLWNQFVFIMDCFELFCLHPLLDKKQVMVPCVVTDLAPSFLILESHPKGVTMCFKVEATVFPEMLFYQTISCSVRSATRYLPTLYRHVAHIQLTQSYHLVLMKVKSRLVVKIEPQCEICSEEPGVIAAEPCYPKLEETEFLKAETRSQIERKPIGEHQLVFDCDRLEHICPTVLQFLQYNIEYLCQCWMPGLVYNAELLVNNCYINLDMAYATKPQARPPEISVWLT